MLDVRYFGIVLGQIDSDLHAGGGFVKLAETMPVGTEVEAGNARFFVTRVDESEGGCWLKSSKEERDDAVPTAIAPDLTVRDASPEAMMDEATPSETSGPSDEPRGKKRKNRKTSVGR